MLTINNLNVKYGDKVVLNINKPVKINYGDRIGIIGSNGAGKSTLVKSILGLTNYKGSIITKLKPEDIGVHMQSNEYVECMKIKYIMEAILGTKIKKNKRLQELISFFNFEACLNKKFNELSGGQKQRMTIIMVLMKDVPLVFFDEVTSGLDFETRQQLMDKINEWYENKTTAICIVSHYYEELEQIADKLLIIDKGRVVDFDTKEALFKKYCGNSVITISNNKYNEKLIEGFNKIISADHLIALSCSDVNEELSLIKLLVNNNVNFKRSDNDIEIMYINAKATFNGIKGEVKNECKAI